MEVPTSLEMTVHEGLTSGSVPVVVGPYDITVVANGFKTVHQNDVMREADQKAQPDFARPLDALNQTTAEQ